MTPRVALVNNSRETFTPTVSGAIATCLWETSRAAAAQGVRPTVLTRGADADPYAWPETVVLPDRGAASRLGERPARVRRRLTGWGHVDQQRYACAVLAALREAPADVVVCNNDPEIAVYLARRLRGVRVVHWFHNLEYSADRWRRDYAVRGEVRSVAVSRYLARAVEGFYRLTPGSVACAYPGVDSDRFAPADRSGTAVPLIGFLGRICVEKGVDVLLGACLELADRRRDFRLQLIGDTNWGYTDPNPYRLLVDDLVARLRACGVTVIRTGHLVRAEVARAAALADIHVVPSRWDEPFGLVVLEGMACGLPVVVSAAGGMPELMDGAGVLVAREDPSALARALGELLDDPQRRATLGTQAQRRASGFAWSRTWQALLDAAATDDGTITG